MSQLEDVVRVFDLHSDLAVDIAVRRARGEKSVFRNQHYPRLQQGGVQALVSVLWVEPEYRDSSFSRWMQLLTSLLADLDECRDCVELVTDEKALSAANAAGKIGLFLGLEGMTFVEDWPLYGHANTESNLLQDESGLDERLRQVLGVLAPYQPRYAIFVWGERNQFASGPGRFYRPELGRGLTAFGRRAAEALQQRKILLDLSHLDDTSIDDVLEVSDGPIIASHSNARALCDVPRNLLDRHIVAIAERGGVIGINAYPGFVHPSDNSLDRYIDHLIYISDKIGIEHVALGFDFVDYLPGYENRRRSELDTVLSVPALMERLQVRGLSKSEIEQVAWKNAIRLIAK